MHSTSSLKSEGTTVLARCCLAAVTFLAPPISVCLDEKTTYFPSNVSHLSLHLQCTICARSSPYADIGRNKVLTHYSTIKQEGVATLD